MEPKLYMLALNGKPQPDQGYFSRKGLAKLKRNSNQFSGRWFGQWTVMKGPDHPKQAKGE